MKKNERNAGAKPKFPNIETEVLRISRIVPKERHEYFKKKCNELINKLQSEALDKCVSENLKNK